MVVRHDTRGFTFIEILIVLAITAILMLIVVKMFFSLNQTQAVEKDAHLVLETVLQARSQTLNSKNATQYGVHFASTTITYFTGASYNASSTSNVIYTLNNRDTISSISLTGGGSDVVFTRLTGETSQDGNVVISSRASASTTKTVTIYKTGLVEVNN